MIFSGRDSKPEPIHELGDKGLASSSAVVGHFVASAK